jgi:hypothetical protein
MQLMDKNSWWDICSIGAQLREHIRPHVVVANHMTNFQAQELILELILKLAYLYDIRVHGVLVEIPLLVDLLGHQQGVAIDKVA